MALEFYACGSFQRCIGDAAGVHKSSVCRIIHRVSRAIAGLRSQWVVMPARGQAMSNHICSPLCAIQPQKRNDFIMRAKFEQEMWLNGHLAAGKKGSLLYHGSYELIQSELKLPLQYCTIFAKNPETPCHCQATAMKMRILLMKRNYLLIHLPQATMTSITEIC